MGPSELNSLIATNPNNLVDLYSAQETQLATQEQAIQSAVIEIRNLHAALESAKKLRNQIVLHGNAFKAEHHKQMNNLNQANQTLATSISELSKKLDAKEAELTLVKAQLVSAETLLNQRDKQIEKLSHQSAVLEAKVDGLESLIEETKKVLEVRGRLFSHPFFSQYSEGLKGWIDQGEGHFAVGLISLCTAAGAHSWPPASRFVLALFGCSFAGYSTHRQALYRQNQH